MNRHKVVVFGSGGQLGVELLREFTKRGYTVTGFDRSAVDISDGSRVERSLAQVDPAVVLNAAAYNQVDVAENEPVAAYNANALAVLAMILCLTPGTAWGELSLDRSTLLLHVFDLKDEQGMIRMIKDRYEKPLMEIFES